MLDAWCGHPGRKAVCARGWRVSHVHMQAERVFQHGSFAGRSWAACECTQGRRDAQSGSDVVEMMVSQARFRSWSMAYDRNKMSITVNERRRWGYIRALRPRGVLHGHRGRMRRMRRG